MAGGNCANAGLSLFGALTALVKPLATEVRS